MVPLLRHLLQGPVTFLSELHDAAGRRGSPPGVT
jgi:hypothetical protein